jgi:hypothetical protein
MRSVRQLAPQHCRPQHCREERSMILVRNVFQAKYGRGDELVQLIKDGQSILASASSPTSRGASSPS